MVYNSPRIYVPESSEWKELRNEIDRLKKKSVKEFSEWARTTLLRDLESRNPEMLLNQQKELEKKLEDTNNRLQEVTKNQTEQEKELNEYLSKAKIDYQAMWGRPNLKGMNDLLKRYYILQHIKEPFILDLKKNFPTIDKKYLEPKFLYTFFYIPLYHIFV